MSKFSLNIILTIYVTDNSPATFDTPNLDHSGSPMTPTVREMGTLSEQNTATEKPKDITDNHTLGKYNRIVYAM